MAYYFPYVLLVLLAVVLAVPGIGSSLGRLAVAAVVLLPLYHAGAVDMGTVDYVTGYLIY
jgi:hypothetical protein